MMFYDIPTGGSGMAFCCILQNQGETPAERFKASLPPTIFFDSISDDGRRFNLSAKLTVSVSQEANMVILETNVLRIIAYGESLEQASDAFQEHFAFLWESIAQQPDEVLTPDAQDTKRTQLSMVSGLAIAA